MDENNEQNTYEDSPQEENIMVNTDEEQQEEFERAQAQLEADMEAAEAAETPQAEEDQKEEKEAAAVENNNGAEAAKDETKAENSGESENIDKKEIANLPEPAKLTADFKEPQTEKKSEIPEKITGKMLYGELMTISQSLQNQAESLEKIKVILDAQSPENPAIQQLLNEHEKQLKAMENALLVKSENAMAVMDQAELEMRQVQRRNVMFTNFYPSWQGFHEDMQEYIRSTTEILQQEARYQSQIYIDEVRKNSEMYFESIDKRHKLALEQLGQKYADEIKKFNKVSVKLPVPKITMQQLLFPTVVSFIGMFIVMMVAKML